MSDYSKINFTAPDGVRAAMRAGLAQHEKGNSGDGLESATVNWAKKIASGEPVSSDRAKQGNRWFGRNARFADEAIGTPARTAYQLWGGADGAGWFASLAKQMEAADGRKDYNPAKRIMSWNGLKIGIEKEKGDVRHGRVLQAAYGHIQNHKGGDKEALDCYIGDNLDSKKIFKVQQMKQDEAGRRVPDEEKMMIGYKNSADAERGYLAHKPRELFGGINQLGLADLSAYWSPVASVATPAISQGDEQSIAPSTTATSLTSTLDVP